MARHGENIRKRADGRWEGRYKAFDESKGREIYRSVYGHTYSEVKGKLMERKYISEKVLPQGNLVPEAGSTPQIEIPFAQLAMEWLTVVAERRKHSTYIKYEAVYKTHLEAVVGQCSLTAAANIELQGKISDHIAEVSPSESLQKSIICVANQILAFAGRKHAVSIPALKQSEKKQSRKPPEPLSKDEQASLLSYVFQETDKFSVAVLLCLYTGIESSMFDSYQSWFDMCLMSFCSHHIIANSTYSWWGAWLNPRDKIVIAPEIWARTKNFADICPAEWIRM